jgi:transcriptional regulator with XRE-family HTH domain
MNKKYKKEIAIRLRIAREMNRLSQRKLAKKVNLCQSTIAQIESGENLPSMDTFLALCIALNVRPKTILDVDPIAENGEK